MKKTILLTGSTGYLGSYLAHALVAQGHNLIILKRKNSSLLRIESIIPMAVLYNIENLDYSVPFNAHGKIDAVIHTATCYGRHGETPSEVFKANTGFPLRLLDAASATGVDIFINTDTILDKYLNLYSLSKNQLLEWGRFFSMHNKIRFINMRLEHFYGPGDEASKFTTHVINSCLRNVPELKLTLGEQKRDFIYIDDVVSAYLIILEKLGQFPDLFNEFHVGSGAAVSIRDFVEKVHHITGSNTQLAFGSLPYRKGEVMSSHANVEPLAKLGWFCKTNLEQGLNLVMEGYKK
ncbi:NAD-dependent epimerase/dehydratase [Gammaproteobacteria bacterium]|nr:NAD-dependent epimerase/dehydratase [Gammaproteobacteria bacterium]